jgi:hypothetical protein
MKPNWDRIDARLAHQMFSWNFDVILYETVLQVTVLNNIDNVTYEHNVEYV